MVSMSFLFFFHCVFCLSMLFVETATRLESVSPQGNDQGHEHQLNFEGFTPVSARSSICAQTY